MQPPTLHSPAMRGVYLTFSVFLVGCGACGACGAGAKERGAARATAAAEGRGESPPDTPDGPPPPGVVLQATAQQDGTVTLRLANRSGETIELRAALALQRHEDAEWRALDEARVGLRWSCADEPPRCVTLAPGAELLPPAVKRGAGQRQCECEGCPALAGGRYRFVARECEGGYQVASEAFELGKASTAAVASD